MYLSLVLGNVNVTLLSKQAKFAYKDEYEKFKLYLTIILILISFTCRFLFNSRWVSGGGGPAPSRPRLGAPTVSSRPG